MQEQTKIEETVDSIKEYVSTRYELIVLRASDKLAHVASNILSFVPLILFTVLTILMLSFALAFYLNKVLNSEYCGFLIAGGIFFAIGVFLFCVRKKMIAKPFRNKIIKEIFKKSNININSQN